MTAVARPLPARRPSMIGGARQVFEYKALVYRRVWRGSLFSTFLSPVLFLAAMGIGLGSFVDNGNAIASLGGVPYAVFLAPGLLAAQGMQTAASESTWTIMGGFVWDRTFHGMYATPVSVAGIVFGQLAWVTARLTMVATAFFVVMLAFGFVELAVRRPRDRRLGADRAGLRRPDHGLRRGPEERQRLLDDLPVLHHPAVPVLGHVLPDRAAAPDHPADRLADAHIPRRGPCPRTVAGQPRPDRRRSSTWACSACTS